MRSSPATTIEPESDAFEPAMHHEQCGFARTGRPDEADRLAAADMRSMSLRICTRAAPRPSDRLTCDSEMAGSAGEEMASMQGMNSLSIVTELKHVQANGHRFAVRSYGETRRRVVRSYGTMVAVRA